METTTVERSRVDLENRAEQVGSFVYIATTIAIDFIIVIIVDDMVGKVEAPLQ
ncbi:hypothetical protein U1Q18_012245 [Sarracenia purpurea var. burkii]